MKGKISTPVYVYLVPKKKWPKKVATIESHLSRLCGSPISIYIDINAKTGEPVGYEFLDCYGVHVDGKEAKFK